MLVLNDLVVFNVFDIYIFVIKSHVTPGPRDFLSTTDTHTHANTTSASMFLLLAEGFDIPPGSTEMLIKLYYAFNYKTRLNKIVVVVTHKNAQSYTHVHNSFFLSFALEMRINKYTKNLLRDLIC